MNVLPLRTKPVGELTVAQDPPNWLVAVRAAEAKKAVDLRVLDLREVTTLADYFVICSGTNPKQIQAIADEIVMTLKRRGERAGSIEGYEGADWILIDYGDLLVHVFSEHAREYYDLERLWRHARVVEIPPPEPVDLES